MSKRGDAHPVVEVALWLALLFQLGLGVVAGLSPSTVRGPFDPFLHAGGSMLLTAFFLMAAVWRPGRGDGWFPNGGLTVVALILMVGVGIEVGQSAWSTDTASFLDIGVDAAGIAVGWLGWWWVRRRATTADDHTSDSLAP